VSNTTLAQVLSESKLILAEYDLCDSCVGRLFAKKIGVKSNKLLGKKIKKNHHKKKSKKCHICKDLLSNLKSHTNKMLATSSEYSFSTFEVGIILKPSIVDRDDNIRSKFKLIGIDSVKTDISKELSKLFAKKTKTSVDHINPDTTFTINFKNNSCEIRIKPVILYGRYTKNIRNIPQKQKSCESCSGKGCFRCEQHGITEFESVEGKIAQFLYKKFGAKQAKFSWIGGEDKMSLVSGKGRPFFVKLLDSKVRKSTSKKISLDKISINGLKVIERIPKNPIKFRSKAKVTVIAENKIKTVDLQLLKSIKNKPILYVEKFKKQNQKLVHDIKFKKISPNEFSLYLEIEGGFPIKKFVESKNVKPNISAILKNNCKCKEFDFHEILVQ